jgi:hypothetical protein
MFIVRTIVHNANTMTSLGVPPGLSREAVILLRQLGPPPSPARPRRRRGARIVRNSGSLGGKRKKGNEATKISLCTPPAQLS